MSRVGKAPPTPRELTLGLVRAQEILGRDVPLHDRLTAICEETGAILGCDRCSIMLLEDDHYRGAYNWGNPPELVDGLKLVAVPRNKRYVQELEADGSCIVINDTTTRPDMAGLAKVAGVRSIVLALMTDVDGSPIGFMTSEFNENVGTFDQLQSFVLLGAARLVQSAILNHRELQRRLTLSDAVLHAEDSERRRIGRDIHDSTLQQAYAMCVRLEALQQRSEDPAIARELGEIAAASRRSANELRALTNTVYPSTTTAAGLHEVLHRMLTISSKDQQWRFMFEDTTTEKPPPPVSLTLSRIAGQALTNVRLHSQANEVDICLSTVGGGTRLAVTDNGRGFDPSVTKAGHIGLITMRERAELEGGSFTLRTAPGEGTQIEAWMPNVYDLTD